MKKWKFSFFRTLNNISIYFVYNYQRNINSIYEQQTKQCIMSNSLIILWDWHTLLLKCNKNSCYHFHHKLRRFISRHLDVDCGDGTHKSSVFRRFLTNCQNITYLVCSFCQPFLLILHFIFLGLQASDLSLSNHDCYLVNWVVLYCPFKITILVKLCGSLPEKVGYPCDIS